MQYEFRGKTLQAAIHKTLNRKTIREDKLILVSRLKELDEQIIQSSQRLARLERTAQRVSDDIENDKESLGNDDVNDVTQIAIALASLIPAVRAVRIGIGAILAARSALAAVEDV